MKRLILTLASIVAISLPSHADEGMWLVNMIESRLQQKMVEKGLQLDSKMIYDEDDVSLSDAVVALAFSCTGSMISDDGLMITNHHCAYSDVHALSTMEHNYLEDGFWAMSREKELPVAGQEIYFLRKVIDVTDEVEVLREKYDAAHKAMAMRKIYGIIEAKYGKLYEGQGEVICSSFWGGMKYLVALYEVYRDVRLVAAPPVSIASFGAEVDNWEWPQHKGDFAIYRIYTAPDGRPADYSPSNVPLHPRNRLKICTTGVQTGDFVMVMGYPGTTNRYASPSKVEQTTEVVNPIQVKVRGDLMEIVDGWMNRDADVRLKYADYYFGLTNVEEIREGEIYCYKRFDVPRLKRESQDGAIRRWVAADASREAEYGTLIGDMEAKYADIADIRTQLEYFRETVVRGMRYHRIVNTVTLSARRQQKQDGGSFNLLEGDPRLLESLRRQYGEIDMRVERDIFCKMLDDFYAYVRPEYQGDYLSGLMEACGSSRGVADSIWNGSIFTDTLRLMACLDSRHTSDDFASDPLVMLNNNTRITAFNERQGEIEGDITADLLERKYKKALYLARQEEGIPQYADANSTMRLTYGTVGPISPRDGITMMDYTTTAGILEKWNPDLYIFSLDEKARSLYERKDFGRWADPATGQLHVDFLSDNDITGGNSGSPVLNARGELVGLAFDGNKESLAGDTWFDTQMNKCINVDIRFVLWVLDKYMGMGYILDEIL